MLISDFEKEAVTSVRQEAELLWKAKHGVDVIDRKDRWELHLQGIQNVSAPSKGETTDVANIMHHSTRERHRLLAVVEHYLRGDYRRPRIQFERSHLQKCRELLTDCLRDPWCGKGTKKARRKEIKVQIEKVEELLRPVVTDLENVLFHCSPGKNPTLGLVRDFFKFLLAADLYHQG